MPWERGWRRREQQKGRLEKSVVRGTQWPGKGGCGLWEEGSDSLTWAMPVTEMGTPWRV